MTAATPEPDDVRIGPLTAARATDYLHYFDRTAFSDNAAWRGCYCAFHYHDATTGEWEARTGACNRRAMSDLIASGRAEGFLAYDGDDVVGWCNAAPKTLFPQLRRLPGNAQDTAFVPCFVVAPGRRRQGIARRLLEAACDSLRQRGFTRLLGKPVRGAASAAENHAGPLSLFLGAGFRVMFEDEVGNVYVEKRLAGRGEGRAAAIDERPDAETDIGSDDR